MHPSITAAPRPPPPPGLQGGIFPPCRSREVGHLQICALPGDRAFTKPRAIPKLLARMRFPIRLTTQRILLDKQAYWLICQGPEKN